MTNLGRPRAFDRTVALEAAMQVFWRQGFLATSMNDLCDAMGIRSPSLYAAFGSKEALYREAVDHYVTTVGPPIWDRLGAGTTAHAGIEAVLLAAAERLPGHEEKPAGCMVALGTGDTRAGSLPDNLPQVRAQLLDSLRSRLGGAVASGELPGTTDIDGLARFFLGVYQGLALQARDGATAKDLQGVVRTAMQAWPAPGPPPAS